MTKLERIDYTVIFAREMGAMRAFYEATMGFAPTRELGPSWVEYRIGDNVLALTERGLLFDDPAPPAGALSLQLAFRLEADALTAALAELAEKGVAIDGPTDQPWGHRTAFFRDPDGNVLELFADL